MLLPIAEVPWENRNILPVVIGLTLENRTTLKVNWSTKGDG